MALKSEHQESNRNERRKVKMDKEPVLSLRTPALLPSEGRVCATLLFAFLPWAFSECTGTQEAFLGTCLFSSLKEWNYIQEAQP
jgi:hypothetical protein